MSKVKWSVKGSEDTVFEVNGHKFATNDNGAPIMCNLYCADLERHVHVDYCRSDDPTSCGGAEIQHLSTRMQPNPEKAKDLITHSLYWKRMGPSSGFVIPTTINTPRRVQRHVGAADIYVQLTESVDPYSMEDQAKFAKW